MNYIEQVQTFLRQYGIAHLKEQFKIKTKDHEDGRIIFNYDQINSPKTHPITMGCRALTLDWGNNWELVARSYSRFFNSGEAIPITSKFRWNMPIEATCKEDGSLLKTYFWDGKWRIQTSNSFAQEKYKYLIGNNKYAESPYTWEELFYLATPKEFIKNRCSYNDLTLIFELCSPYNKVVKLYEKPTAFLLTAFNKEQELTSEAVDGIAEHLNLLRPEKFNFIDIMDAQALISERAREDSYFEGVVLRDCNNLRLKVKSDLWKYIARLKENNNCFLYKNLIPNMLSENFDEICVYIPEIVEPARELRAKIDNLVRELDNFFVTYSHLEIKKFAQIVKKAKFPIEWPLFTAKRNFQSISEVLDKRRDSWAKSLVEYFEYEQKRAAK